MSEVKSSDFLIVQKLRRYGFAKVMDFESPAFSDAYILFLNNTKVILFHSIVDTIPFYFEWYIIHGSGFHCKKIIIENEDSLKQTVLELTGEKLQYGEFL